MQDNQLTWLGAVRWCRDEAGAFFASFWMILALYGLGLFVVYAFFQLDSHFSRPLAGGVIPAEVTQQVAWATRVFAIVFGMAAIWCHARGMAKVQRLMTTLGIMAAVILFLHAYGISAKIMEGQYQRADVVSDVGAQQADTINQQIAAIDSQIAGIERRTSAKVESLRGAIDNITSDGLDNDDEADAYRADITAAQTAASQRIDELEDRKFTLLSDRGTVQADTRTAEAEVNGFNPLFTFMARVWEWKWNPDDMPSNTAQYGAGVVFFTLFWGFGELLMMSLFPAAFAMQQRAATDARSKREADKRSRAAMKAWETRRENDEQETRAARRGGKLVEAAKYYADLAEALLDAKRRRPTLTLAGMLNVRRYHTTGIRTVPELRNILDQCVQHGVLTHDQYEFLLSAPNGADRTEPEDGGNDADDRPSA